VTTWTPDDLERIGAADELEIASRRPDGSLGRYVTIWVVRIGDDIYVRSAFGPDAGWFARAVRSGTGRIRAGGVERDVDFERTVSVDDEAVDAEYHRKYDHYGHRLVDPVVGPEPASLTLRLLPR